MKNRVRLKWPQMRNMVEMFKLNIHVNQFDAAYHVWCSTNTSVYTCILWRTIFPKNEDLVTEAENAVHLENFETFRKEYHGKREQTERKKDRG